MDIIKAYADKHQTSVEQFLTNMKLAAIRSAIKSDDIHTQCGSYMITPNLSNVGGTNKFPSKVEVTTERQQRPQKYDYMVHGEIDALTKAARFGYATYGALLYTTHFPCKHCALTLIAAGVNVIYGDGSFSTLTDDMIDLVQTLFAESGLLLLSEFEVAGKYSTTLDG